MSKSDYQTRSHSELEAEPNSNDVEQVTSSGTLAQSEGENTAGKNIDEAEVLERNAEAIQDRFGDREFWKQIYATWEENKYGDKPDDFFAPANYPYLHSLSALERIALLARACAYLRASPDMAAQYFSEFKDDAKILGRLFFNKAGVETGRDLNLLSTCAPIIAAVEPTLARERWFQRFLEIAERKRFASTVLLDQNEPPPDKRFVEFGEAANGFFAAWNEAAELDMRGDHFINPDIIFTAEYHALKPDQRAKFLRNCIIELQEALVHDEVYSSRFTKERIEKDRQYYLDNEDRSWLSRDYNVAHSMIFRTFQPLPVFSLGESYFQYEMNNTAAIGGCVEEFPFHRLLKAVMKELAAAEAEKDANTDLIVDFWDKNRNPLFGNDVAEVLSRQNPERAAQGLMKRIRTESGDKRALAAILYRLEFGQIGISQEGVKYLERMYDLGVYNNPDYHVSRLTPTGEVGIFNEEKELIKYFELGDLTTEEKKIKAEVLDFTYETLFLGRENESEEERTKRLGYLEEFKKHYYELAQDKIFEQSGIQLNNLSFREQGWFLRYLQGADQAKRDQLTKFVQKYGEDGIRSFLVMEYGDEHGDKVLFLGEHGNPKEIESLLRGFSEIVQHAEALQERISEVLGQVENPDFFGIKFFENLIQQGKNCLTLAHNLINNQSAKIPYDGYYIPIKSIPELIMYMNKIRTDLDFAHAYATNFNDFNKRSLSLLEPYLFDSKNLDRIEKTKLTILLDGSREFCKQARNRLADRGDITFIEQFSENQAVLIKLLQSANSIDLVLTESNTGKALEVENNARFSGNIELAEAIFQNKIPILRIVPESQYVNNHNQEQWVRNKVFFPDYNATVDYGFSFDDTATWNPDILDSKLLLYKDLAYTRRHKPEIQFDEANLAAYEAETFAKREHDYELNYSNPDTLALIEEKTANTTQTLYNLFKIANRNGFKSVLDLGTGEGRIGIPLAMRGFRVTGIDQVDKELASISQRINKEVSKTLEPGYSWKHLKKLIDEGELKESDLIFNANDVRKNYQTVRGNFFDLEDTLIRSHKTFERYDLATFTWHTFCETGTIDNQIRVLKQVYNRLNPGGMVYIEIPDRTVGAYKYALNENLKQHPNEPVGVSRDSTCLRPGVACVYDENATPRFFPGRDEIRNLLRALGFEHVNLDTYLVTSKDKAGKEFIEVKVLVITAMKPAAVTSMKDAVLHNKKYVPENLPLTD
jgi:SAM-dependent methyltransferase